MSQGSEQSLTSTKGAWFEKTHWSIVLAAKNSASPEAMNEVCRAYWRPLYQYIKREGYTKADAQDLTQKFFVHLLAKDFLAYLKHQDGKFRSFLLKFLKHFLADERDKAAAQKRGGDRVFVSFDEFETEERCGFEPKDNLTPDQVFDRRWAETLMEQAEGRLQREYTTRGKQALYEALKNLGVAERETYAQIGKRLGMSESAIKSAMRQLRQRHQAILIEEIERTVGRPEEVEDERRHLMNVVGAGR